mmetsp:Transcript_15049/g.21088  ORF Transcript_15049/g.21088 Transcript_15049/m.21088 type:complete len:107 (+) Transcript_15049:110-430(+)
MSELNPDKASEFLNTMLRQNKVVVISATYCSYCVQAKSVLVEVGQRFVSLEIDIIPNGREVFRSAYSRTGSNTVPQIFINQKYVGGYDALLQLKQNGKLQALVQGE